MKGLLQPRQQYGYRKYNKLSLARKVYVKRLAKAHNNLVNEYIENQKILATPMFIKGAV